MQKRALYLSGFTVLVTAGVLIGGLYVPSLTMYFISDDFDFLSMLLFNFPVLLNGQYWEDWYLRSINGYVYFRPLGHTLFLVDFIAWNLDPIGYHLSKSADPDAPVRPISNMAGQIGSHILFPC